MNDVNHASVSEPAAPRVGLMKARRGRPRKECARDENIVQEPAAAGTAPVEAVTNETVANETAPRERSLLLATLRVWELEHGISE
jgi:hypothetical protein